jgi:two-component system sensor histidine kinase PilS (NtrC family)
VIRPTLDLDPLLRGLGWARLAVAGFLVALGPWTPSIFLPATSAGLLLAVVALVAASSGAVLVPGLRRRPHVIAPLLCLLDAVLVTAVVAGTGGARSMFVCLYVLLVVAACLLLSRAGALAIALLASGLYAAVVASRNLVLALVLHEPVEPAGPWDVPTIVVLSGTLTIVSLASGGLSERLLRSQRELEHERRARAELQALTDAMFRSIGTGLVALDRAQTITAFNPAAQTITGVPMARACGASWADLFGPWSLRQIEAVLDGDPRASVRHEIDVRRPDGVTVPVRITVSALEARDGTRLGGVATCEDLSPIRAMEAEVRQADRLATLGRMAANIAHEIRNPLASLSGAVEALTRADIPPAHRARLTEIVLRESERLSEMIDAFVEYARPAPLRVEPLDAVAVVDEVLGALRERMTRDGVKIVRVCPPSLPLEADRQRLRQVLSTLCLNALGAMPAGGELRVEGRARAGTVEIRVTDKGERISAHDLAHVFEPFFRARHDATGLGLALVHRIVGEHRGEVAVRSEPDLGAEFTVRLPERHG